MLSLLRDRVPRVRLSLYANNAVLFINPTKEDMRAVVDIMKQFGDAIGLCMNMSKNVALPIWCAQIDLDEVLQCFHGERATFPMNYLGLPITLGRLRMTQLQPCLD
jgi:hypothetical protein